jgi:hypothetical protein
MSRRGIASMGPMAFRGMQPRQHEWPHSCRPWPDNPQMPSDLPSRRLEGGQGPVRGVANILTVPRRMNKQERIVLRQVVCPNLGLVLGCVKGDVVVWSPDLQLLNSRGDRVVSESATC